jgi:predicted dehydrogenase
LTCRFASREADRLGAVNCSIAVSPDYRPEIPGSSAPLLLPTAAGITLDHAFQCVGDKGVGNVSFVPGELTFWREDGFEISDISYEPRFGDTARGALRDELAYFCQCVRNRRRPEIITPREAKNAVRLALAVVDSANTDREVEIQEWN